MIHLSRIFFVTLAFLAFVFVGCAPGQAAPVSDSVSPASIAPDSTRDGASDSTVSIPEALAPSDSVAGEGELASGEDFDKAVSLPSWNSFCDAMQAIEDLKWSYAKRYLEDAQRHIAQEAQRPDMDPLYLVEMPLMISSAMEEVMLNLPEDGGDDSDAGRDGIVGLGPEDEPVADSASILTMEEFLESLDLSQFSLPIEINERVLQEIYYLSGPAKGFISGSLNRKTAFDSLIYAKLEEAQMPKDLIYLSLVESGFKVRAYSPAQASGLWQFIPETGRRYGVDVDLWLDQRRNPEMATEAALKYLNDLYVYFGDWQLAMAAYNCGEGRIRKLIRELKADTTRDQSKPITYWDLPLPAETMLYVPRILAAMVIGHYPEQYDITIKPQKPVPYDTVTVYDSFSLEEIARHIKVKTDVLSNLNSELIMGFTPPNRESYTLRVPVGKRDLVVKNYDKMEKNNISSWVRHRVRKGESLGKIAQAYNVRVTDVQQANNIKNMKVRVGQTLLIPIRIANNGESKDPETVKKTGKAKTYIVKLGDNLSTIARKFNVAQENIRIWNNMDVSSVVSVGDIIFVSKPDLKPSSGDDKSRPSLSKNRKYVVRPGDTYATISKAFDVPVGVILLANKGYTRRLFIGDSVYVPKYVKKLPQPPAKPVAYPEGIPEKGYGGASKNISGKVEAVAKGDPKAPKVKPGEKLVLYTVESGDNLGYISMLFGMSIARIQELNGMGNSVNIRIGQKLYVIGDKKDIPLKKDDKKGKDAKKDDKKDSKKDEKKGKDEKKDSKKEDKKSGGSFRQHTVKKGESLWDISRQYKVSIDEIVKWNNLPNTKIKEGLILKIQKK